MSLKNKSIVSVILFGLIACVLYGLGAGIRSDIGILLNPLAEHAGLSYENVSTCIAFMQLVFGASQPFFGILAARKSNRFVLLLGIFFLFLSLTGMIISSSFVILFISLSVLFGLGAGAIAFGLVLSSAIHFVGQNNAMIVSGMLNAAAGMVGFILSPLLQNLIRTKGLNQTLFVLIMIVILLIPFALFVTSRDSGDSQSENSAPVSIASLFQEAIHNRTYRLLLAGFSTCGFHMVIIESHLFSQFVLFGIDEQNASWAYSIYGIATIFGALLSGFLSTRIHKGKLLGFYYGFRAVWVLICVFLLPKNMITAVIFSIGLGMSGDATVSPTSGLVSENFSVYKVATLTGVLFFGHQIGAFFSAWLGGLIRTATGSYTLLWILDAFICTFACVMSMMIHEEKRTS